MPPIDAAWLWAAFAMMTSLVVISVLAKPVDALYSALAAPIAVWDGERRLRALGRLVGAVTIATVTFSLTGGGVGYLTARAATMLSTGLSPEQPATPSDVPFVAGDTGEPLAKGEGYSTGFHWGFLVGLLMTGIARIRASYGVTGLTNQLRSLTIIALALATFWCVLDWPTLWEHLKEWMNNRAPFGPQAQADLTRSYTRFPLIIGAFALGTGVIVEALLYWNNETWGKAVSRFAIRQRFEEQESLEQIFFHRHVNKGTKKRIREEISRNGIQSVSIMADSLDESYLYVIDECITQWARRNSAKGTNAEAVALELKESNIRLAVSSEELRDEVSSKLPQIRRIIVVPEQFSRRLIILNGRLAIALATLPQGDSANTPSNFAAFYTDPLHVRDFEALFDAIWGSTHFHDAQIEIMRRLADVESRRLGCRILGIVCEHPSGIDAAEMESILLQGGVSVSADEIETELEELQRLAFIWKDNRGLLRFHYRFQAPHISATLVRLFDRQFTSPTHL